MGSPVLATTVTVCKDSSSRPFDRKVFPAFSRLLDASQEYARLSGCRFRSRSFDGLRKPDPDMRSPEQPSSSSLGDMRAPVACHSLSEVDIDQACRWSAATLADGSPAQLAKLAATKLAKLGAGRAAQEFATRVQNGDPELAKELEQASSQVLEEGVRNAMVATCRRLELWPPSPASIAACQPGGKNKLPVVAQHLYQEAMEPHEVDWQRRMRTAAFVSDFGDAVGATQSPMPEREAVMLQEFNELASRWELDKSKEEAPSVVSMSCECVIVDDYMPVYVKC